MTTASQRKWIRTAARSVVTTIRFHDRTHQKFDWYDEVRAYNLQALKCLRARHSAALRKGV